MQLSSREIRESLRLLSEQPIGFGSRSTVDEDTSRLIFGQLRQVPDMRMDKVCALRLAIQEQRYHVPEEEVAEQMLGRCFADHIH